jgi:hypothetical protein
MGVREYDASIGRFWTQDTFAPGVGDLDNANLYVYVGGNPVNAIDPTGNDSDIEILTTTEELGEVEAQEDSVAVWLWRVLRPQIKKLASIALVTSLAALTSGDTSPQPKRPPIDVDDPDPRGGGEVALFRAPRATNLNPFGEVIYGFAPTIVPGQSSPGGVYFGKTFGKVDVYYRQSTGYWNGIQAIYLTRNEYQQFTTTGVLLPDPAHPFWGYYVPVPRLPEFNVAVQTGTHNAYYPESFFPTHKP